MAILVPTKSHCGHQSRRRNSRLHKRPSFPKVFVRQLAGQFFQPSALVALIARQTEINANLRFKWRRQYP
jgi:transposase-like protein